MRRASGQGLPEGVLFRTHPIDGEAARDLTSRFARELGDRYRTHITLDDARAEEFVAPSGTFLIAYVAGRAAGCGGIRYLAPEVAEVKHMYVEPAFRRRGVARAILSELERAARDGGYRTLRLETGTLQPEAIRLYEAAGYARIPCFGTYASDPDSVCYEKEIIPSRR